MKPQFSKFCARLREFISNGERGEAEFNSLALELFELQFAHNPAYRRFCESRGVSARRLNHWRQIPAIPATAFKELALSCLAPSERTMVFHSSGTTEQRPSRHFNSAESLAMYEASLWAWFESCILGNLRFQIPNSQLLVLTPSNGLAPCSSLVHMFDTIRRRLGADESVFVGTVSDGTAWTLDFDAALQRLRSSFSSRTPLLVLGTAFSFVHLLDCLAEQDLRFELPPGSRAMETGGYKGRSRALPKEELHALITNRLGIPASQIVCEYGMSELSSQAYGATTQPSRHSSLVTPHFRFPAWARVQIVSPETGKEVSEGETGLIRVFDLANVFSVMAVQTEDLGIRRAAGFELVGRAALAESRGCSLMTV